MNHMICCHEYVYRFQDFICLFNKEGTKVSLNAEKTKAHSVLLVRSSWTGICKGRSRIFDWHLKTYIVHRYFSNFKIKFDCIGQKGGVIITPVTTPKSVPD